MQTPVSLLPPPTKINARELLLEKLSSLMGSESNSAWCIWIALSGHYCPKKSLSAGPTQLHTALQDGDCMPWSVLLSEGGNISFAVAWRGEPGGRAVNRPTHRKPLGGWLQWKNKQLGKSEISIASQTSTPEQYPVPGGARCFRGRCRHHRCVQFRDVRKDSCMGGALFKTLQSIFCFAQTCLGQTYLLTSWKSSHQLSVSAC